MRTLSTRLLLALALPLAAHAQQAQVPASLEPRIDFAAAKKLADQAEDHMESLTKKYITTAQGELLNQISAQCASPDAVTTPFTIVVKLDQDGKALDTWRQGDTKLAQCFEQQMRGRPTLVRPPSAPYYLSFEVSFTQ